MKQFIAFQFSFEVVMLVCDKHYEMSSINDQTFSICLTTFVCFYEAVICVELKARVAKYIHVRVK